MDIEVKGTKIPELSYLKDQLDQISPTQNTNALIIGERAGKDGVYAATAEYDFGNIICTDAAPLVKDSYLVQIMMGDPRTVFIQQNFLDTETIVKRDVQICISVLEHFGLWIATTADQSALEHKYEDGHLEWNYDLRAIEHMIKLLKDDNSRIIITVPWGRYMNYRENGIPWLRYYDSLRRDIITDVVNTSNCELIDEHWYISSDFVNWRDYEQDILTIDTGIPINYHSPNTTWAFTIQKKLASK